MTLNRYFFGSLRRQVERLENRKSPVIRVDYPGLHDQPLDWNELGPVTEAADAADEQGRFASWAANQPDATVAYLLFLRWVDLGLLTPAFRDHEELWAAWAVECHWYRRDALLAQLVELNARDDLDEDEEDYALATESPPLPCGLKELPDGAA